MAEVERDEGGEGGGLAGIGAGFNLLGKAGGDGLPDGGLTAGLRNGEDAQLLPELGQGAKNGSLGDFLAEVSDEVVGGFGAVLDEQGVGVGGERRDLAGARGGRRLLPGFVAAKGEDEGEGGGGDDEVRRLGGGGGKAEQVERDGGTVGDETSEQGTGGRRGRVGGVSVGDAEGGFDEGGGGDAGELGLGREEEKAGAVEELAGACLGDEGDGDWGCRGRFRRRGLVWLGPFGIGEIDAGVIRVTSGCVISAGSWGGRLGIVLIRRGGCTVRLPLPFRLGLGLRGDGVVSRLRLGLGC